MRGRRQLRCSTCGGRLQFVVVEENGDPSYICTKCGDEWYGSTLDARGDEG